MSGYEQMELPELMIEDEDDEYADEEREVDN